MSEEVKIGIMKIRVYDLNVVKAQHEASYARITQEIAELNQAIRENEQAQEQAPDQRTKGTTI